MGAPAIEDLPDLVTLKVGLQRMASMTDAPKISTLPALKELTIDMHACKLVKAPPTLSKVPKVEVFTINMKDCEELTAPPLIGMMPALQTVKIDIQKCKSLNGALPGEYKSKDDYVAKLKAAGVKDENAAPAGGMSINLLSPKSLVAALGKLWGTGTPLSPKNMNV